MTPVKGEFFMRQPRSWRRNARPIMVILERADWPAWLDLTRPDTELLHPLPAGSLTVEQVRP
jgi:hypothetical protein